MKSQRAVCVRDQLLKRAGRKPRIEQQRDRPSPHRAEEELDEFQPIADQHGDALPGRITEPRQHPGDAVHALVELTVGRLAFAPAKQVDDGDLVRHPPDRLVEKVPEISTPIRLHIHCSLVLPTYSTRMRVLLGIDFVAETG